MHSHAARGQWAVDLLQYNASVPGAVGSGTPAMQCHTDWWKWAVELVQCTATVLKGRGGATTAT